MHLEHKHHVSWVIVDKILFVIFLITFDKRYDKGPVLGGVDPRNLVALI